MAKDTLGVGFRYEDVLELCQKATQIDKDKQVVDEGWFEGDEGKPRRRLNTCVNTEIRTEMPLSTRFTTSPQECRVIIGGENSIK